ncbi:hypothetical protein [Paraburkholderia sediminicola]|uniref:hypothetical protein n=1 Tax=Paraburkholderia sediminicola TaxID=458836 RepID=UPI0038B90488
MGLKKLTPLFELPHITWFSVQKGDREHESEAFAGDLKLHTRGPVVKNFTDPLRFNEDEDQAQWQWQWQWQWRCNGVERNSNAKP